MRNIKFLSLVILGCIISVFCDAQKVTSSDTLKSMVKKEKTIIVDVRTLSEFAHEHTVGTLNMPIQDLSDSTRLYLLKGYENIIVVCKSGVRARKAKKILEEQGFTNVYNGGSWKQVGEILTVEEDDDLPEMLLIR